ncbi:aminotransferase class V-fold PLP-dependent enzyme [Echinicola sp. 20G]|uniref:aminotransferase class V-fold PLP-dependent enzyme n=1 Tax=Echinicola sp. 20G TaxID=2781961 RepID=UPI0019103245|nr:aminotransferase class V-fold PLP-dependent enzyme [Echinicola sp. 20G]
MNPRRLFIEHLSKGALGLSVIPLTLTSEAKHFPYKEHFSIQDDEQYWKILRRSFPLKHHRIYFNNGTFGPSPKEVVQRISNTLLQSNETGNYGHTNHSREILADLVKVSPKEISLTHNTTEGINVVCWGLPLKAGDEVIITYQEHVGNALPWINRAKLDGIVLKPFEPGKSATENIDKIKQLIGPKTRVIAIPHITTTTGLVFPIKEISQLAKKHDIYTAIDGAHGVGTFDLDLKVLGCDFYATSCHKWLLGPNGTGFLYINGNRLEEVQAYQVGAYSDTGWDMYAKPPQLKGYVPTAHRFDYGSQSAPLYEGAAAAAEFHKKIGQQKIEKRIGFLSNYLFEGLQESGSKIQLLTPEEKISRINMVTFKPKNLDYKIFNQKAIEAGFRLRVVPESGLDAIRGSTHIYNSPEEIDKFLKFVRSVT